MNQTTLQNEILSYLEAVYGTDSENYPIYEFTRAYGKAETEKALWTLWKAKKVRMVPISDYRDMTSEELADCLEGVEETFAYVRFIDASHDRISY